MLKCKHGCGHEHTHRGAMNLHERIHCPTLRAPAPGRTEDKKKQQKPPKQTPPKKECDCEDGGKWALIPTGHPAGREHSKYCTVCGEVK